jgi:hypothetical protein
MGVFLYSSKALKTGRDELEDDINEFLSNKGYVTGAGAGIDGWNLDIEIIDDDDSEAVLDDLKGFLKNWPVPDEAYLDVNGKRHDIH